MRSWTTLASPLAAVALCAAAARPAAAQRAVADDARPLAVAAGAPTVAAVRPVATYRFAASRRQAGMPDQVTVADSGGVIVASLRLPGAREARPMVVDLFGSDIVLQGQTPEGVLTLRLYGQSDPEDRGAFAGRWWLGDREGTLRGRVSH